MNENLTEQAPVLEVNPKIELRPTIVRLDLPDFLAELTSDAQAKVIDRGLIRARNRVYIHQFDDYDYGWRYRNEFYFETSYRAGDEVITSRSYLGQTNKLGKNDLAMNNEITDAATQKQGAIEAIAQEFDLDLRSGLHELE